MQLTKSTVLALSFVALLGCSTTQNLEQGNQTVAEEQPVAKSKVQFLLSDGETKALIDEQCKYFAAEDKVKICHRLDSDQNYELVEVELKGCSAHMKHADDYLIATKSDSPAHDPDCAVQACYPEGAPILEQNLVAGIHCCAGLSPDASGHCRVDTNPKSHICKADTSCNVCDACCHDYLHNQPQCASCVQDWCD